MKKINNSDVYIKDDGDFAGVLMLSDKAKKTAIGSGPQNAYDFIPNQFRVDILLESVKAIEKWAEQQNLILESEI